MIGASIEGNGLVMHVQRGAPQLPCRLSVVGLDPHPPSRVVSQSERMIRVLGHVLNVAVPAHAGVEEHGDGGPGAVQKAALDRRTSP